MIKGIVTFAALVGFVQLCGAKVTDCSGDDVAKLKAVTISGCDLNTDSPCLFFKQTNASIEVEFEALKTIDQATVEVYGKLGSIKIPFPLHPNDACANYGFDCPVQVNDDKKLKIQIPVLRTYPSISLQVLLRLLDQNKKQIVCLEFPVRITSK